MVACDSQTTDAFSSLSLSLSLAPSVLPRALPYRKAAADCLVTMATDSPSPMGSVFVEGAARQGLVWSVSYHGSAAQHTLAHARPDETWHMLS